MTFNTNLTRLRKEKGFSQEQLALEIGVFRQYISKWERGASQPELSKIDKICEVLEITPNELMGYKYERADRETLKNIKKSIFYYWYSYSVIVYIYIYSCKTQ